MSTSPTLSQMYPPSVRPGTGIPLADFVRGMTYNASFVSDYTPQSPFSSPPSITSVSTHSSAPAPPNIMTASLPPPYASVAPNARTASLPPSHASSTTLPPSYGQLSHAPPGYAAQDPNQLQRIDQAPSTAQSQIRGGVPLQPQPFIPAGYTIFGQHPNIQYEHPSFHQAQPQASQPFAFVQAQAQLPSIQHGYPPFQQAQPQDRGPFGYAQAQAQQPSIQYQYPQQQQAVYTQPSLASQTYSLPPQVQFTYAYGQIQNSPSPSQPPMFLPRVIEEDTSSEEDDSPPQRTRGRLLRGVRYHIGGR